MSSSFMLQALNLALYLMELNKLRELITRLTTCEESYVTFKKYTLERVKTADFPETLKSLQSLDKHEHIIFAYIQNTSRPPSQSQQNTTIQNETAEISLFGEESLGGSPLKLEEFSINSALDDLNMDKCHLIAQEWKKHTPLSVQQARKLLSLFNVLTNPWTGNHEDVLPFFILCDQSIPENILYLGNVPLSVDGVLASLIYYITSKECQVKELPSLKSFIKQHNVGSSNSNVEVSLSAVYDVFGGHDTMEEVSLYPGSLSILVTWSSPLLLIDKMLMDSNLLSLIEKPTIEPKAILNVQVSAGDTRSPANTFYRELCLLKSLCSDLGGDSITWLAETRGTPLIDDIKKLVEEVKQSTSIISRYMSEDKEDKDDTGLINLEIDQRINLDFTEKLWNLLVGCTAYSELVEGLNYVLNSIQSEDIQPVIHRNNTTHLSRLIQDSYNNKLSIPNLCGFLPLEMMIEIGIGKLRRDYAFFLIDKDLVTAHLLKDYLVTSDNLPENIRCLEKLHQVVELVLMLKLFLHLPVMSLRVIARQALKHYEHNPVDPLYIFKLPIETKLVSRVLHCTCPKTWSSGISSTDRECDVMTTCHLQARFNRDTAIESETSKEDEVYQYTQSSCSLTM